MKCPVCNIDNPKDAYYCHNCGKKLRTRVSGWMICSIALFLGALLLGYLASDYADWARYYESEYIGLVYEKKSVSDKVTKLNAEISSLNSEITSLNSEIGRLRDQVPQLYTTKNANQYLYYWKGHFERADLYYKDAGVVVTIYAQKEGYGLSDWGWIPMDGLEKN